MMTSVWMVTEGEYSDYRVVGVFSTEERAKKFVATFPRDSRWFTHGQDIEEVPLDPALDQVNAGMLVYFVRMSRDGVASDVEHVSPRFTEPTYLNWGWDVRGNLYMSVWATDPTHAVKIVNEYRAQLIANNEWKGK